MAAENRPHREAAATMCAPDTASTPHPTPRRRIVVGPEHGEAWAAGLRVCAALRNAMLPFRGKDPAVDEFFAILEGDRKAADTADEEAR